MGGICGIASLHRSPIDPHAIHLMARAASHRAPDGIRYLTTPNAAFAQLALELYPQTARKEHPAEEHPGGHNASRQDLLLVADARLDNRDQLLRNLSATGYLDATASATASAPTDEQLLLTAYRCWGERCPEHLLGDFAFALWDPTERRLFAARDAMAMRPFYYRLERDRVLFASEVKQVLAAGVEPRLFEPAVGAHLAGPFGMPEWSFYEGISQLPPAHALVVDQRGSRTWRYWDIDPERRLRYTTEEEYVEHFLEVFEESVRCRLRTTRPVGLFLSGGVDSGTIASTAGWSMRRGGIGTPEFRAYSWAFEELAGCDERHISGVIAGHYGFPVTEVPADDAWPLKDYPLHAPDRDDPFIGVYQALIERTLSVARSEGMGLVISGDRGDLMVGAGAFDHLGLLQAGRFRELWQEIEAESGLSLGSVMRARLLRPLLLNLWPPGRAEWLRRPVRGAVRRALGRPEAPPSYPDWVRPEFARQVGLEEVIRQGEHPPYTMSGFARQKRYDLVFLLMQMRGMVWSERTWSHFGLQFADPWSDRRLAEFVLAVPQWRVQRVGQPKRIARQAMRGVMPEKARRSVRKIVPYPLYRRALEERATDTVMDLISGSQAAARGYLDEGILRDHYRSVRRGETEHNCFWWALTLEMWLRQHWS